MQTIGPYLKLQVLGTCQVGAVWSAADSANNHVTVAVLDTDAARDPGLRNAFATTASSLEHARQLSILAGDFSARAPWIASPTTDGAIVAQVFVSMGMTYQPVAPSADGAADDGPVAVGQPPTWSEPPSAQDEVTDPAGATAPAGDTGLTEITEQLTVLPGAAAATAPDAGTADAGAPDPGPAAATPGATAPEATDSAPPATPPADIPAPPQQVPFPPQPPTYQPTYQPVSDPPGQPLPQQPPYQPTYQPVSGQPACQPSSGQPAYQSTPPQAAGAPGWSSPPGSAAPAAGWPQPVSGAPEYGAFPLPPPPPAAPTRRRTWALVGLVASLVVVLGVGAGTLVYFLLPDDDPPPVAGPTTAATPSPTRQPPAEPGVEPPLDGQWPEDWPAFGPGERVVPMTDLADFGLTFEVPATWTCPEVARTDRVAHHSCGPEGGEQIGGDLTVRVCPDPCDADRRVEMRRAEEAWGLQWVRDGGYRSWAETEELQGEERYALVIVGYWRSSDESRLDRQVVFRMTAPVEQADVIRKIANSLRSVIR